MIKEYFFDFKMMFLDILKLKIKEHIPNLLSLLRIMLIPLFLVLFLNNHKKIAMIFIVLGSLTDCIDGWYARHFNCQSKLGALLDTISDKLFAISILIPLIIMKNNLLIYFLVLEIIISIINSGYYLMGIKTKTSIIGKIKTISLDTTIILYYISFVYKIDNSIMNIFYYITVILQVIAMIDYFYKYLKLKMKMN